jgi:hypothetical protein
LTEIFTEAILEYNYKDNNIHSNFDILLTNLKNISDVYPGIYEKLINNIREIAFSKIKNDFNDGYDYNLEKIIRVFQISETELQSPQMQKIALDRFYSGISRRFQSDNN